MKFNFGNCPKQPAASAQECWVCPHCNRHNTANLEVSSLATHSTSPSHDQADNVVSPTLSLREALQSLPDHQVPEYSVPISKKRVLERRPLTEFLRGSQSIMPMVHKKTMGMWKRTRTQPDKPVPPARPNRPPPEQCPPDQPLFAFSRAQIFPNTLQLPLQLPEITSLRDISTFRLSTVTLQYLTTSGPDSEEAIHLSPTDVHHDLAYSALTGDKSSSEDDAEELEVRSDSRSTSECQDEAQDSAETPDKNVGIWYRTHNDPASHGSFSTLPSTVSKMALKPSPLRLAKGFLPEIVPPIPVRSPLRLTEAACESNAVNPSRQSSKLVVSSLHCRPSYYTMSVYSTDSDGHTVEPVDTPPSSLLQTPQHQKDQSFYMEVDAYIRAEEIRNELGIIDDIYDMYADNDKHIKHEACVDEIKSLSTFLQPPSRLDSKKVSRAQRRLQKQQARDDAIEKLEGLKTDCGVQEPEFEQWLDKTSRGEVCSNCSRMGLLSHHGHRLLIPTDLQQELSASSDDLSDLSEAGEAGEHQSETDCRHNDQGTSQSYDGSESLVTKSSLEMPSSTELESEPNDVPSTPTSKLPPNYRPSLAILQEQLQALMGDDTESTSDLAGTATTADLEQPVKSSSPCSSTPSTSTDGIEYGPDNLQKVEIVWNGRRFPVLIGHRGRIWEGPCTDAYCKEHGGLRKELAYGMF